MLAQREEYEKIHEEARQEFGTLENHVAILSQQLHAAEEANNQWKQELAVRWGVFFFFFVLSEEFPSFRSPWQERKKRPVPLPATAMVPWRSQAERKDGRVPAVGPAQVVALDGH